MEAVSARVVHSLQIGVGWLPEEKGNGLDRVYYALHHHLPNAGVETRGLVVGPPGIAGKTDQKIQPFATKETPLRQRMKLVRESIQREIATYPCDLVASHFALYTYPALGDIRDLPLVVHFHGPWAEESRAEGEAPPVVWAKKALEKKVYRQADRFIVLSKAFRSVLIEQYGVPEDRIRIVRGGVELKRFIATESKADARQRLGWPADRPTLLVVRRLSRRMGVENLIDAIQLVRQRVPDVLLHIAGTGPIRDELKQRIQDLGLEDNIAMLGFVPEEDLPAAYRAADFTVVPTVALEGFGLITVESMAAGTPVLVTNIGGLPEVVRDLSEDLIMRSTEPAALADHLSQVLTGTLTLPSAEACELFVRERYDWAVIAQHTRQVYEEVLS